MSGEQECGACGVVEPRPVARTWVPVCADCWRRVPAKLRTTAIVAHRRRRVDPARSADAVAGVLQWCRDQRATRGEESS